MTEQFLAPVLQPQDDEVERSLRPRRFDDFVGQTRVKEQLAIALEAARTRGEALDHVLLVGPPGLGKTSLAYIVRRSSGRVTSRRSSPRSRSGTSSLSTRSTV